MKFQLFSPLMWNQYTLQGPCFRGLSNRASLYKIPTREPWTPLLPPLFGSLHGDVSNFLCFTRKTKIRNRRRLHAGYCFKFHLQSGARDSYWNKLLILFITLFGRKFADHRLSLRVKTKHRPTCNPVKQLMSRKDIRSEFWKDNYGHTSASQASAFITEKEFEKA